MDSLLVNLRWNGIQTSHEKGEFKLMGVFVETFKVKILEPSEILRALRIIRENGFVKDGPVHKKRPSQVSE